jgi:hypothetical protein
MSDMSDPVPGKLSLREIELEVEAEGREWMRRRLEERLQREADRDRAVFPPQPAQGAASAQKGAPAAHRRRRG